MGDNQNNNYLVLPICNTVKTCYEYCLFVTQYCCRDSSSIWLGCPVELYVRHMIRKVFDSVCTTRARALRSNNPSYLKYTAKVLFLLSLEFNGGSSVGCSCYYSSILLILIVRMYYGQHFVSSGVAGGIP